ncbi:MAG: hypothetical protein ACRC41_12835 [Sarcina sp.]
MILGSDIGSYAVKTSEKKSFLSLVQRDNGLGFNDGVIEINGESFLVGQGEYDNEYRKCRKRNFLTLLYTSIAMSSEDEHNKIIVGLPISQFKRDREELRERILSSREANIIYAGKERKIIIDDADVYCEGLGAVESNFDGVIVDLGGRTTDIFRVSNVTGKSHIQNPFSEPVGTLNLYSDFIKDINTRYGLNLKANEAERIIKQGLKIKGNKVDISKSLGVFKDYVEMIIDKLKVEYPIDTLDLKLMGGGALILGRNIKKKFNHAEIIQDSIFTNAIAYRKVGEKKWLKGCQ